MPSKAKKKTQKTREDFTDEQLRAIHQELATLTTSAEREKVYKKNGAARQSFTNWFGPRGLNLGDLPTAKPTPAKKSKATAGKAPKKVGKGPVKATATAPTPAPEKKPQTPKAAPAKKAPSGLDEDVRQLIALQARVISRLMGNE